MTALPNTCYSRCHKARENLEDNRETLGKKIWIGKCRQWASGLAGGRWRRLHKTELDGDEWSVIHWEWQGISQTSHGLCDAVKKSNTKTYWYFC